MDAETRQPRSLSHALLFSLLCGVTLLIQRLPVTWVLWCARRIGNFIQIASTRYRRRVRKNLDAAFGDGLSPRDRRRLTRRVFQNFAMTVCEAMLMPAWVREGRLSSLLRFGGHHRELRDLARNGQPLLLLSGHLGSWELLMAGVQSLGATMVGVMRPTHNPWFNDWMRWLRRGSGQELTSKRGAMSDLRGAIGAGKSVGLLVDQHDRHGIPVDFFGRPALTNTVMGILAQRYRMPIFVGYVAREIPGRRYRFFCVGPLDVKSGDTPTSRTAAIAQQCTAQLEGFIRQMPDQWFWLHRRWRHADEAVAYDH